MYNGGMDREAFDVGFHAGMEKCSSALDDIVSLGMNVLSDASKSRIAKNLPDGPVREKVLMGEPLTPFLKKLFRSTYESS